MAAFLTKDEYEREQEFLYPPVVPDKIKFERLMDRMVAEAKSEIQCKTLIAHEKIRFLCAKADGFRRPEDFEEYIDRDVYL